MTVHVCVCVVHVLMQVSAAGGTRGLPSGSLVCAKCVHGMALRHKKVKMYKTHSHWLKHVKHGQSRVNPSKGTHLSPIQHTNVTRTFYQTPNMQQYTTPTKNAWTWWNLPQYMFNLPQGANTVTNTGNGTQPNQNFERIFTKMRTLTQFSKIPNFLIP